VPGNEREEVQMDGDTPEAPRGQGRREIYYWKCDRPAAFHGTQVERETALIEPLLRGQLEAVYPGRCIQLQDAGGQGNHLTWIADIDGESYFIRVENGPEQDNHLEVESHVMAQVRACGVPTPLVHHVDVRREVVPFAWQMMDLIPARDLNEENKRGTLDAAKVAPAIGAAIARWQDVPVSGFGHFDARELRQHNRLRGFHDAYRDYFLLNWHRHLAFLEHRRFLSTSEVQAIELAVDRAGELLSLTRGCLVHKDLAFWNILGSEEHLLAYIDWDDAVAADEADDLSLLGCFHDGPVVACAMAGYRSVKLLPDSFSERFWLHLLRNLIVKSVIRVGAGYGERSDGFFLIGPGLTGADLLRQTHSRLLRVLEGLRSNESPENL
jgi:aminoglycoside phosphotransferase (APT) family kinase protein